MTRRKKNTNRHTGLELYDELLDVPDRDTDQCVEADYVTVDHTSNGICEEEDDGRGAPDAVCNMCALMAICGEDESLNNIPNAWQEYKAAKLLQYACQSFCEYYMQLRQNGIAMGSDKLAALPVLTPEIVKNCFTEHMLWTKTDMLQVRRELVQGQIVELLNSDIPPRMKDIQAVSRLISE